MANFEARLDHLKDSIRTLLADGGDRAKSVATSRGRMIKLHPIAAVAIAAGIGFGVFMLVRSRR